jgi:GAF domain-containing protein/sugar diacid utilization regulator
MALETQPISIEHLMRACEEMRFLQRISADAAATDDYDQMLRFIIDETTGVMRADVCSLYLLEPDGWLVLQATNGLTQHAVGNLRLRLGEGVTGWVAQERQPLALDDARADPRFVFIPGVDDNRLTSMLSVPVIARERVVGVLNIQTAARRRFDEDEVAFLQALASQVAGIIEGRRLHRQVTSQLTTLQMLFRVSSLINSTLDLDELLRGFLGEVGTIFPATIPALLLTEEGRIWVHHGATHAPDSSIAALLRLVGERVAAGVVGSGQPLVVDDLATQVRDLTSPIAVAEIPQALLSVPLTAPDRILGALHIFSPVSRRFTPGDVELAMALANQAALAIRNAQRYANERRAVCELDIANRRLHRAIEIHQQFTQLVLADRGVAAIAQTLADLLDERVLVENPRFTILAAVRPRGASSRWRDWHPLTLSAHTASRADVQRQLDRAIRSKRPIRLGPFPEDGLPMPRTVLAIAAGRQHFGFLSVIHERSLEDDESVIAMEQAATVLAVEFLKQKVAFEAEQRLRGDLVEQLLTSQKPEEFARLLSQLAYLGIDLSHPYLVLLADLLPRQRAGKLSRDHVELDLQWLLDTLETETRRLVGMGIAVLRQDAVVLVLPCARGLASEDLLERLHGAVVALIPDTPLRLAASEPCASPEAFRVAYRQALRTLAAMRRSGRTGVMSVRHLGPYHLLLAIPDDVLLRDYAVRELGPLLEYDRRHRSQLAKTLQTFLQTGGNLKRTAEELYIHINTLAYRMQRIKEIIGENLEDSERRMALHLAFLALDLVDETVPAVAPRCAHAGD